MDFRRNQCQISLSAKKLHTTTHWPEHRWQYHLRTNRLQPSYPTGKPVYLAASIQTRVNGKSTVTFHYADLSESKSELQSSTVSFQIAHGLQNPATKLLLGGRDQRGHLWDGQLARLLITPRALKKEELLFSVPVEEPTRTLDLKFNQPVDANNLPLPNTEWVRQTTPQQEPLSREQTTLTDLCHVLLTSNEFLYLH